MASLNENLTRLSNAREDIADAIVAKGGTVSSNDGFEDFPNDFIMEICDISAGGIKFISKQPLEIDKHYQISVVLSNNMKRKELYV